MPIDPHQPANAETATDLETMSKYNYLEIESGDHITLVTLNRPERRNALDGELAR